MSKQPNQPADPMDAWRQYLTKAERDWNKHLNQAMGSDAFSQVMGTWMTSFLALQKNVGSTVEKYLEGFNLPTRSDIVDVGERLTRIEERLRRIEAATAPQAKQARRATPPRTRKPPSATKTAQAPKVSKKAKAKKKTATKKTAKKA